MPGTLARSNEGTYTLARDRSSVDRAFTKAFPEQHRDRRRADVRGAAGGRAPIVEPSLPDGRAFTLRQHISLRAAARRRLSPARRSTRASGSSASRSRISRSRSSGPLEQRWISRHRLERVDPNDPNSAFRKPITYYIDPGIPEPLRTATVEGARFWEEAFDQAGLPGGFRVEMLPAGADPMDARYNTVHVGEPQRARLVVRRVAGRSANRARSSRAWRTWTRTANAHRLQHLRGARWAPTPAAADTAFVLARIRQVTAHEIGHTLGMAHNYIASTYERGSVMDYPRAARAAQRRQARST